MPKALKDLVQETGPQAKPSKKLAQPKPSAEDAALEFQALYEEAKEIEKRISKLKKFLKEELPNFKDQRIDVLHEMVVRLIAVRDSRSFDLASAEEMLSRTEAKKLRPYVETRRSLDLETAEKHLDMKKLAKFVTSTPSTPQLKLMKKTEE